MGTGIGQFGVGLGNGHAVARGFCGFQTRLDFSQACVAVQHKLCGRFVGFWHVLGHLGHAPGRRDKKVAAVFMQRAIEQGKQR